MNLLITDASLHYFRAVPVLAQVRGNVDLPVLVFDIYLASDK